jgi:pilus assembly protein Flp/PilA
MSKSVGADRLKTRNYIGWEERISGNNLIAPWEYDTLPYRSPGMEFRRHTSESGRNLASKNDDILAKSKREIRIMFDTIKSVVNRLKCEEEGATLVEYVLLVALIGVAAVVGMGFLSSKAQNTLNSAGNSMP